MKIPVIAVSRLMRLFKAADAGSAIVETALVFPILIALLAGSVQLGEIAYASIETANAARAGAQYAAMNGGAYNDTTGIANAANSDAFDTYTPHPTRFVVSSSSSCSCSDATACTLSAGVYVCASGAPVITVSVNTTATYATSISVPGLFPSNSFTLHGFAQQEVLQ